MKQERKKLHGNRVKNSDEPNNDKNEPKWSGSQSRQHLRGKKVLDNKQRIYIVDLNVLVAT